MIYLMTLISLSWAEDSNPNPSQQIQQAYEREYAYINAERNILKQQLDQNRTRYNKDQQEMELKIVAAEGLLQESRTEVGSKTQLFQQVEQNFSEQQDISASFEGTLQQASQSLGVPLGDTTQVEQFKLLVERMESKIASGREIKKEKGLLYLEDGSEINGEITKVGHIAAFATSDSASGILLPIGDNKFRILSKGSDIASKIDTSQSLTGGTYYLTEGFLQGQVLTKERTMLQVVDAGGIVAYIIAGLGIFGLLLATLRGALLFISPVRRSPETTSVISQIQDKKEQTHDALLDIAEAGLTEERVSLQRFGMVIVVIAAIAPLLGLLGTVTGMISTFEIITEHGTGDPRMLSGGISEALITTQMGLVVAIPMLLLGNMLNGWSDRIYSKLESSVLQKIAQKC